MVDELAAFEPDADGAIGEPFRRVEPRRPSDELAVDIDVREGAAEVILVDPRAIHEERQEAGRGWDHRAERHAAVELWSDQEGLARWLAARIEDLALLCGIFASEIVQPMHQET